LDYFHARTKIKKEVFHKGLKGKREIIL